MRIIKQTYAKDDCIHYKIVRIKGCCSRYHWGGVCIIPDQNGNPTHKTCSTKMKYCNYVKKEEEDVHLT